MEKTVSKIKQLLKIVILFVSILVIGALIFIGMIWVTDKAEKKARSQPMICEEPVFPETIPAENGGQYVRRLSTYWWVEDILDGKIIAEDVNKYRGALFPSENAGLIDLDGNVLIPFVNRDIHFTETGYISVSTYANNETAHTFYDMDLDQQASFVNVPHDEWLKYEGERYISDRGEYVPAVDTFGGSARYYGKFLVLDETGYRDNDRKVNTCVYVLEDPPAEKEEN